MNGQLTAHTSRLTHHTCGTLLMAQKPRSGQALKALNPSAVDALVLWSIGSLVLWCIGALVLWCIGPLLHWCFALLRLRRPKNAQTTGHEHLNAGPPALGPECLSAVGGLKPTDLKTLNPEPMA